VTMRAFVGLYPDIVIGDIEPSAPLTMKPDWRDALRAYKQGLDAATGTKLDFLELDIAWSNPGWPQAVGEETAFARSLGMHVGYIYNGDDQDRSDPEWLDHARRNIAEMEGGLGLIPDHISISSWNAHPANKIATPLDGTLASLMIDYARPRTRIALDRTGDSVTGRVLDDAGHPLSGYTVSVGAVGLARPDGRLPEATLDGTVPSRARSALLGLRINLECFCVGLNDVLIGDFDYREARGGDRHETVNFLHDLRHFAAVGGPGVPKIQMLTGPSGEFARVTTTAGQAFMSGLKPFAVTPDATYRLTVAAQDLLGSAMYGTMTIIWLDADGQGFGRDNLILRPDFASVADLRTDNAGRFSLPRPRTPRGTLAPLRITVPDQQGHRAAIANVPP